jgi:anti-sigma regulatory factor (Ser/Thr protein kinase)
MRADDDPPSEVLLEQTFDVDDLGRVRHLVHDTGVATGMSPEEADRFTLAVDEGMTNAIMHGGEDREVAVSLVDGVGVVAEVVDDGHPEPFVVPDAAPPPERLDGRGLWLASQSADQVSVSTAEEGTSMVVEMNDAAES